MGSKEFTGNETEGAEVPTIPGQEEEGTTQVPGYVTKDDLDSLKQEIKDELKNLYRGVQSQTDKLSYKVQQRLESYEAAAKAQGVTLTSAQKQIITDQATLEELRAVSQTSNGQSDQISPAGKTEDEFVSLVNKAAETMLKQSGITFDDTDPEVDLINKAAEGTAEDYLKAHREAIRLKKERLAKGKSTAPARTPVGAVPGAVAGSPNANPIANISDRDVLWEEVKRTGRLG